MPPIVRLLAIIILLDSVQSPRVAHEALEDARGVTLTTSGITATIKTEMSVSFLPFFQSLDSLLIFFVTG